MTEAEAKTKWCPFTRVPMTMPNGTSVSVNRSAGMFTETSATCIGSACMAWRWNEVVGDVSLSVGVVTSRASETDGYCGRVGKP